MISGAPNNIGRPGRTISRALGNGLTTGFTYYAWNAQVGGVGQGGRPASIVTGALQNLAYTYDAAGNITQTIDSHASETSNYGYDGLNRLTGWSLNGVPENYTYDGVTGNLATKSGVSYTYNSGHAHAVSSLSDASTYQYDANGNMTQRIVNGQTFNLGYDAENRIVSVSGAASAAFVYDGDGTRVKSTIAGMTTYFVGTIYEASGSNVTKYYYAYARRVAMRVNATLYYLLTDNLGSTTVTADAIGNLVSELRYTAWGAVRSGSSPAGYTFTGQYSNVTDFGLIDYNARWYDPALGRFAQADTAVGYDRYAYVGNNPVNYTDPTGNRPDDGCRTEGCASDEIAIIERRELKREKEEIDSLPPGDRFDCFDATPCISSRGGSLPTTWTFHLFDSNVVSQVPIYDYTSHPPRVIGYTTTSYAYDKMRFDPSAYLPLPRDPVSTGVFMYEVGEILMRPSLRGLAAVGLDVGCPPCDAAVRVVAGIHDTNEAVTLDGDLGRHDVYFTASPIVTPFDAWR